MTILTLRARQVFAQDLYATQATGVVIDAVEPRHARCSVQLTPLLRNAMGAVMGGVMFTLADLAFAAAANSECIEQDEPLAWVTTGSSIDYLSQPADHTLSAETQCIKQGRTTCLYLVHITDGTGRAVAMLTTRGVKLATSPTA